MSRGWPEHTRVLVVEDDLPTARIIQARLEMEGIEVLLAGNGVEALDLLQREDVSLITTDLMMPAMNGFRLVQEVRDLPPPKGRIPILLISSNQNEQDMVRCLAAGADDYMIKPISAQVLVERLWRLFERSRRGGVTIRPLDLPEGLLLHILLWATLVLISLVSSLILFGTVLQFRRDRQNRHRIACFKAWEVQLAEHLFSGDAVRKPFSQVPRRDRWLFRSFLFRYQATLAGQEAETLRSLYLDLGVHASLPRRLRSRQAKRRAQAAQEIGGFRLPGYYELLLPLLQDSVPFVAHVAALALGSSQDLRFAGPVMAWVLREDRYQRERLLRVLEGFGPDLLPWLEVYMEPAQADPEPWIIFALLAGSHRHRESQPRLLELLSSPSLDLQAAVLKALAALADPAVYPRVLPLASHEAWEIRAQAAKAIGVLGGPEAIPDLMRLAGDRVYEVRRNATQGLADLGHAGTSALDWLAEDPTADPFARDMARERLEWADERGHQ